MRPVRVKRFLPYYRHLFTVRWQFAAGVAAGMVYALSSGLGMPLLVKVLIPILFNQTSSGTKWYQVWMANQLGSISREQLLFYTTLWIPIIFFIRAVADYTNSYLISFCGQRVLDEIRFDLFAKLQRLPLSFFRNNRAGDLLARLMSDTNLLRQIVATTSSDLIKQPATLICSFCYLAYQAWTDRSFAVALIALVTVPACVLFIRFTGKKMARRARSLQEQGGVMTAALAESLQAALEIRAYNLEERQNVVFRQRTRKMRRVSMKVVKYRQAISPTVEFVSASGFAVALYVGVKNGMTQEGFMSLGMALIMSYEPLKKLGNIHSLFKQGNASLDRIEFISNQPDTVPDCETPVSFVAPKREIVIDHLSFAYIDEPVLRDVSLRIPIGQVVALVGPSGAGKTTFAHLLPRFYDPQSGGIRFDDIDIRSFSKKDLRNAIAVVPQMPTLFKGTVKENIELGREGASDAEIEEAARRANAHDFILTLPNGYNTDVGERGDLLSGGQRQRIAIARAFLKDAPILILDEAMSALDSESEAMIQQALAALIKGRTTFIIAHRFSSITIADRILVFQNGRIVGDGSHATLRETDPIYQSMIGSQFSGVGA